MHTFSDLVLSESVILAIIIGFALLVLYGIARIAIVHYFRSIKNRYDRRSDYIAKVALVVLLCGFTAVNPNWTQYLINMAIQGLNHWFDLDILPFTVDVTWLGFSLYCVFVLSVVSTLFLTYKTKWASIEAAGTEDSPRDTVAEFDIPLPEVPAPPSPHLTERMKELFGLKYENIGLDLQTSVLDDRLLYGICKDIFSRRLFAVFCDDRRNTVVSIDDVASVMSLIDRLQENLPSRDNFQVRQLYYVITDGTILDDAHANGISVATEDEVIRDAIDFRKYLKNTVLHDFQSTRLFSIHVEGQPKLTLKDTYIAPRFRIGDKDTSSEDTLESYVDGWLANDLSSKQLVILSDYGMGKTSFLKYYAAHLAEDVCAGKPTPRIPVFISLTNTSPRHKGIAHSVKAFVSEHLGVSYRLFQLLVDRGKILFLLDAFDEMGYIGTHKQRLNQFSEIWQLATKGNKMVLSGRPSYFPSEFALRNHLLIGREDEPRPSDRPYGERITLEPLDDSQIREYVSVYYPQVVSRYFDWIVGNSSILDLCRRPSMMHIIRELLPSLVDESRGSISNAADAVRLYMDHWFERQEDKEITSVFAKRSVEKKKVIFEFFENLSAEIYCLGQQAIALDRLRAMVVEHINQLCMPDLERAENREGLEAEIIAGYFIEVDNDEYRFVHKSFQEYFVACAIVDRTKKGSFNDPLLSQRHWSREVLDFLSDMVPRDGSSTPYLMQLTPLSKRRVASVVSSVRFKAHVHFMFMHKVSSFVYRFAYGNLAMVLDVSMWSSQKSVVSFCEWAYMLSFASGDLNILENIRLFMGLRCHKYHLGVMEIHDAVLYELQFVGLCWPGYVFVDVQFARCTLIRGLLADVCFDRVAFFHCRVIGKLTLVGCKFRNVDFSGLTLVVGRRLDPFELFVREATILDIKGCKESDFDDVSLDSLIDVLRQQRVNLSDCVVADTWWWNRVEGRSANNAN